MRWDERMAVTASEAQLDLEHAANERRLATALHLTRPRIEPECLTNVFGVTSSRPHMLSVSK
jgi:hypothetical protein